MARPPSHKKESFEHGQTIGLLPRSRRWDGEVGEAEMAEVAGAPLYRLRWKDGLTASSDRIEWQLKLTTDRSK